MKRSKRMAIVSVTVAGGLLAAAAALAAARKQGAPAAEVSRYRTVASVAVAGGAPAPRLTVEVKDLVFADALGDARVAEGAFYIAQLKSGEIEAEVAGKKERHSAGDIWTVAADQSMSIHFPPRRQTAQLRIITVTPVTGK